MNRGDNASVRAARAEGEGVWLGLGGVATNARGTSCCGRAQGSLLDRRLLKPREPWSY